MPRKARLDFPGAKHHVMARGIAKSALFLDDADRERLLRIAARVFADGRTRVFAWALMPNHMHWLVETGTLPMSRVFQRIHGAYAQGFNRRHDRVGHLFQDRFVSMRADSDEYLATLLRYVHRNPLDGGVVRTLDELEAHAWTGYGALVGRAVARPFHDADGALALLDEDRARALAALDDLMAASEPWDGADGPPELPGWLPTSGRAEFEAKAFGVNALLCHDRDLPSIVREFESRAVRRSALRRKGWTTDRIVTVVARRLGVEARSIRRGSKRGRACRARAVVAHLACDHLGATRAAVADETGVLPSAITHALRNGESYARAAGIDATTLLGL